MKDKTSNRRERLATLLRATSGTIRIDDAMSALELNRPQAAKLLAGWHREGAIRRVSRGLYVPVSPTSSGHVQVLDNPWVLVPALYNPAYIGGWSALEHWKLTGQLFRSVCVLTSKRTSYGHTRHQDVGFYIKHISEDGIFGTRTLRRENRKILISDPHKTMLDIIHDPYLGPGLQHTVDSLREFKAAYSAPKDRERLLSYAHRFKSGALFKKLGFLAERLQFEADFIGECANNLTSGYTHLDKRVEDTKLVTKWRLWVPKWLEL